VAGGVTHAIEPIASNVIHAASGATAAVSDILVGTGLPVAPVIDVANNLIHSVEHVVDPLVTPITSVLDHGTGGALSPVTNILHGLLG
jgi:hypothetical protein